MKTIQFLLICIAIGGLLRCNDATGENSMDKTSESIVYLAPFNPVGIWKAGTGKFFPAETITKDLAQMGFTGIIFMDQAYDLGFCHKTTVANTWQHPTMKSENRDYLEELLTEADKYGLDIWVMYTTPWGAYKNKKDKTAVKKHIYGLNSKEMINLYSDVTAEIGKKYGKHKSLAGIFLHELDCTEVKDTHSDELKEFSDYCKKNFGEKYEGSVLPPSDKSSKNIWYRRFILYRNSSVNQFSKAIAEMAKSHGLKTSFCYYIPEGGSSGGEYGYDPVEIEKICDNFWVNGTIDSARPYHTFKGIWLDVALSYKGVNPSKNNAFAFTGKPSCLFESKITLYPEFCRKYYEKYKKFTKLYGDYYYGYNGVGKKEMDIYYGKENAKKWFDLQMFWQGGKSGTNVAVAVMSRQLVLRFLNSSGEMYKKHTLPFFENLSSFLDVDGVLVGGKFFRNAKRMLQQYELIIIPQEMGTGLTTEDVESLKAYLEIGGKILVVSTPLVETEKDITNKRDRTEEICGIKIKGRLLDGNTRLADLGQIGVSEKKAWVAERKEIKVVDAKILIKDKFTDAPMLTRKGNAYFLAMGYSDNQLENIARIIDKIASPPIYLTGNQELGVRIIESVIKDGILGISLFPNNNKIPAAAKLHIAPNRFAFGNHDIQVKNVLTGNVLKNILSSSELEKGVKIEIKFKNEPFVVAVGSKNRLAGFTGIVNDEKMFKGMSDSPIIESPEVAITVPDRPGIKVGIYHNGLATKAIFNTLCKRKDINAFLLPRLDVACMGKADVIIIPEPKGEVFFNKAGNVIRNIVEEHGKGVLLIHAAVGHNGPVAHFADEIGKGAKKVRKIPDNYLKVKKEHPAIADFKHDEKFLPEFKFDHITIAPGTKSEILFTNKDGEPVIVCGKVGKGKVILNGCLPGYSGAYTNPGGKELEMIFGRELDMLIGNIKWLAGKK